MGRCIAGREIKADGSAGGWIRPVSARPKGELASIEYSYPDHTRPKLLDVMEVPLIAERGEPPQTENHVISPAGGWKKVGRLATDELAKFVERPDSIWICSGRTRDGHNDCMSADEAAGLNSSLLLIEMENFTIEALSSRFREGRAYRGRFFYREKYYNFSVTDPGIREMFDAQDEGDYPLENVYLCLSLTRPYEIDKRCHKLIAAVIGKEKAATAGR